MRSQLHWAQSSQHPMRSLLHWAVISAPNKITASLSSHLSTHEITASLSTVISAPHKVIASVISAPHEITASLSTVISAPHKVTASVISAPMRSQLRWAQSSQHPMRSLLHWPQLSQHSAVLRRLAMWKWDAWLASHFHIVLFSCTPFGTKSYAISELQEGWNSEIILVID